MATVRMHGLLGAPNVHVLYEERRAYSGRMGYLWRALRLSQMDWEYAVYQMRHLAFMQPSRVYRAVRYHQQTKNQWSRDDPAFMMLLAGMMAVTAVLWAVSAPGALTLGAVMGAVARRVVVELYVVGAAMATALWYAVNQWLVMRIRLTQNGSAGWRYGAAADGMRPVEWLYALDVHCNAFFGGVFVPLYVLQLPLLPLLKRSAWLGNGWYAGALSYYCYITWLGYDLLPGVESAQWLLAPIAVTALVPLLLALVSDVNLAQWITRR